MKLSQKPQNFLSGWATAACFCFGYGKSYQVPVAVSFNDDFKRDIPWEWRPKGLNHLAQFLLKHHLSIMEKYNICVFSSIRKRRLGLYDKDSCICHTSKIVKHGRTASLFLMNISTPIQRHACVHTQKD